jgi:hypothetical protein
LFSKYPTTGHERQPAGWLAPVNGFVHQRFINNPAPKYHNLIILRRPELAGKVLLFLAAGLLIKHLLEI